MPLFSCMGSGVKQTKLNRSLLEHAVQIQTVVTAFMVMPVPSINPLVPDPAHFLQTLWFLPVQFLQKVLFHLLAVTMLPLYIYLKCLIDQIFLAVHDVGDVPQCPCIMGCRVDMHMDACILSRHRTCMPELPDEFLYDRDICIFTDGRNKFYLVLTPRITAAFFCASMLESYMTFHLRPAASLTLYSS